MCILVFVHVFLQKKVTAFSGSSIKRQPVLGQWRESTLPFPSKSLLRSSPRCHSWFYLKSKILKFVDKEKKNVKKMIQVYDKSRKIKEKLEIHKKQDRCTVTEINFSVYFHFEHHQPIHA